MDNEMEYREVMQELHRQVEEEQNAASITEDDDTVQEAMEKKELAEFPFPVMSEGHRGSSQRNPYSECQKSLQHMDYLMFTMKTPTLSKRRNEDTAKLPINREQPTFQKDFASPTLSISTLPEKGRGSKFKSISKSVSKWVKPFSTNRRDSTEENSTLAAAPLDLEDASNEISGSITFSSSFSSPVTLFQDQNYEELKRECQKSGKLFKDPKFSPSCKLLPESDASRVKWLRPHKLCPNPQMFVNGPERFDINQGAVGDCWVMAAMANLAENKSQLEDVIPMDQGFGDGYCGIFHFRIWWPDEGWVDVVIDDRLPAVERRLIYARSSERTEFWSALLEKAYAKLYGSYKALDGGWSSHAAVNFTGGTPQAIDLTRVGISHKTIFHRMSEADAVGAFMGCGIAKSSGLSQEAKGKGLIGGHAYTITKVVEFPNQVQGRKNVRLVRIRNPWGHEEWKGEWSDGDRAWKSVPSGLRSQLKLRCKEDGEFYMSFKDFMTYFTKLEICQPRQEEDNNPGVQD